MAVKIRLKRIGKKKNAFYRVVVADARSPRDGKFIEELGTYNPLTNPGQMKVDIEKIDEWLSNGAQATDTVRALIKKYKAGELTTEVDKPIEKEVKADKKDEEKKEEEKASETDEESKAKEASDLEKKEKNEN